MIDMFVERAAPGSVRGDHWRVSWYDRELGKFVGGAGASPWKALAWAMVGRVETERGLVVIARNASDSPESTLAHLLGSVSAIPPPVVSATPPAPTPLIDVAEASPFLAPTDARSSAPFMPHAPKKSAAARRSATRKTKSK